jgi:hypothetical protein
MSVTINRDEKIKDLKRKIAWACCVNLLSPPLPHVNPLVFAKSDNELQRQIKRG